MPHVGSVGVAVSNFGVEEAQAYLKGMVQQWSGDRDREEVAQVAHRLSYFPLALASAAGCASKYELKPQEYLEELNQKKMSVLFQKWEGWKNAKCEYKFDYSDVVRVTWERLGSGEDAAAARELLRKMALLDRATSPCPSLPTCDCCYLHSRTIALSKCSLGLSPWSPSTR